MATRAARGVRGRLEAEVAGFRDRSALFAVMGHPDAAALARVGLGEQAHRGGPLQRLVISDGHTLRDDSRREGLESELVGRAALGQLQGEEGVDTPLVIARYRGGPIAVSVTGRFTNGTRLRRELRERGSLFRTHAEAEVLAHLIAQSRQGTLVNRIVDALWRVEGAYCVGVLTPERMVLVRDPHGFRPLVLGRLGDGWAAASEDTALHAVGAERVREVRQGEMVILDGRGTELVQPFIERPMRVCAQEHVCLAREDARVFDRDVYAQRRALGELNRRALVL